MTIIEQEPILIQIKNQVAKILLEHAGNNDHGNNLLTQRDIATMLGTTWDVVNLSLKSLMHDGVIRIERNRLFVKKQLVQKIAGTA